MSEDLIKRSDAIKAFTFNSKGERIPFVDCDNFPVEFPLRYIVDTLVALLPADRPQGEWIRTGRTNIYGGIEVQCSNCGDKVMVQHLEDEWYCRHCGADMGMKGADDE